MAKTGDRFIVVLTPSQLGVGNDNLRALGNWYSHLHATVGDQVEVLFLSPTDIQLTLL